MKKTKPKKKETKKKGTMVFIAEPTFRSEIPKLVKGGIQEWFERMADEHGQHPRTLLFCPRIMKSAGFSAADIRKAKKDMKEIVRACLVEAKDRAARHNNLYRQGLAVGYISIKDDHYLSYLAMESDNANEED